MPRGVSIYNGDNDEIEKASVVVPVVEKIVDGVTAELDRDSHSPLLEKVTASMTTNDSKANDKRIAMAVEFDHMYIGCSESKASIGKDIEVQHLKDLLLLHLDLIQQQAEQLVAKDKLIKSLRDENENLRSKLDRIDRRVSLSLSKKSNESTNVEPKTEPASDEVQLNTHPTKRLGSPVSRPESQTKNQSPSSKNASCSKSLSPSTKSVSPSSKPVSPANKAASPVSKPVTPVSKPGSPTSKPGSPVSKAGSPVSKPVSPSSKPVSPASKPGSPASKPVSPASKPGSPPSKPGSPPSKPGSPPSKPGSPPSKPGSPPSKPGSPPSKPGSPPSKPGSPPSKPGSPPSKPGSPPSKPGSPLSKPGSPASKPGSPPSKPGSPPSKPGSPPSKPGSPPSKPGSPVNRSPNANKCVSLASKTVSPSNKSVAVKSASSNNKSGVPSNKSSSPQTKLGSTPSKTLSPTSKTGSPTSKSITLNNKTASPPCTKPISPLPKTVSQSNAELPSSKVESPNSVESSSSKTGSVIKTGRRPSPRWSSPKTPLRERRQRNASQSQSSENDVETEPSKELPKGSSSERERSRLKRRSESESESTPGKRIRLDRDRTGHLKDDGLTDHNLRSRDKSKERGKSPDELPASPVERPVTPTPRAAALEAKKLRQKLQLKGKTPTGNSVRSEGVLNTCVSYYLPYGTIIQDPNPEEEECLQAQVEIPRWGTRMLTSLYVMEGTENLEDEIFIKRHAKPEQDEKRRKRWDLQRMREQRHYERLRERYESRQNASEPTDSGHGSLWPYPESAMYLHVEDTLPVCAFGQPLARIPPQEFAIPWLSGQCLEGVSTRRRKR